MSAFIAYASYAAPLILIFAIFARRRALLERVSSDTYTDAVDAGLTQPASLHPIVDTTKCIGCESCVNACPEFPSHQVLGIVHNKAKLVSPTDCIGHGACKTVCPTNAISLVFGTAERGVELPTVDLDFSTNVPGVYIAGELGGMGLIKNAIEQGRQAMLSIAAHISEVGKAPPGCLDTLIVGAGPAGLSATLGAMQAQLCSVTIEQNALGGTVASFPRGKLVMTAPAELPVVGSVQFTQTRKEELVAFWHQVQRDTDMQVQCNERLLSVEPRAEGLLGVTTDKDTYTTRTLLLAIGRRGTPRTLGVPGEELPKVAYSMIDPEQYANQQVLVVGGGDSALEAACAIAELGSAEVTLSYRSDAFARAKRKNRERVATAVEAGALQTLLCSRLTAIEQTKVLLEQDQTIIEKPNDAVIVCAGGILPSGLLEEIGVLMETKFGTA